MTQRKKGGRPKVQHIKHVHVIELSPAAEEAVETYKETQTIRASVRAAGEALKGLLSHPAGLAAVTGIITWIWLNYFGGTQWFQRLAHDVQQGVLGVFKGHTNFIFGAAGLSPDDASRLSNAIFNNLFRQAERQEEKEEPPLEEGRRRVERIP